MRRARRRGYGEVDVEVERLDARCARMRLGTRGSPKDGMIVYETCGKRRRVRECSPQRETTL